MTGMSGVGKSTALEGLAARGFDTVDTDYGNWIREVGGQPVWDEPRMRTLLYAERHRSLFVQGTVSNLGEFRRSFRAVVLLTAPTDVIMSRLQARTTNDYGKSPEQRAKVLREIAEVEPLLRAMATHVVDTRSPPDRVVDSLIAIAAELDDGAER